MKTVAGFIMLNAAIVAAQLTAAITVLTVAPLINAVIPQANEKVWPWFFLMVGATALAINVLRAATR